MIKSGGEVLNPSPTMNNHGSCDRVSNCISTLKSREIERGETGSREIERAETLKGLKNPNPVYVTVRL